MDPRLQLLRSESAGDAEVAAVIRLRDPAVIPPGVRVVSQFGDIATVRLLSEDIIDVRAHDATESLKAPDFLWREVVESFEDADEAALDPLSGDEAEPTDFQRPAEELATGGGVVVGLADWGCDFAHPSFRHADGSTRIIALWDQRDRPGRIPNNEYGYGYVHRGDAIDRALQTPDPYAAIDYHPADAETKGEAGSHGTHTLHIAAGNTNAGGPGGIAPDADLVFVHLAGGPAPLATLGTSVNLLEAVDFIFKIAGGKPCVINLSLGQQAGSHDGTSPVERGLDAALLAAPGRLICQSCGNYFNRRIHAAGELRPGQQRVLRIVTGETKVIPNEVDLWYSREDSIRVAATAPDGTQTPRLSTGEQADLRSGGVEIGRLYVRANDPNNGSHHGALFIFPAAPPGTWELSLWGEDVVDGRFNAWIERNSVAPGSQPRFVEEDAVELSTTGTICNGYRTIAVGAYNAHARERGLAPFSSRGPTADGRWKPDIAAPGVAVLAARSTPRDSTEPASLLTRKSGTSMASPHVAGTAALVYEIAGPIPVQDMRRLMLATAEVTSGPDEVMLGLGSGYLDIAATTAAARALAAGRVPQAVAIKEEVEQMASVAGGEDAEYWRNSDEMPSFIEDAETPDSEQSEAVPLAAAVRPAVRQPAELLAAAFGNGTRPPYPAEVFDALVIGRGRISSDAASAFEVVGQPGFAAREFRDGDLVISRHLGEPDQGSVHVMGGTGAPGWAVVGGTANVPINSLVLRPLSTRMTESSPIPVSTPSSQPAAPPASIPAARSKQGFGVDVYIYDEPIDWKKLAAAGVDFAYLKASQGYQCAYRTWLSSARRAAADAGIVVGAYHFFDVVKDPDDVRRQARNFLASIDGISPFELPPALDLEAPAGAQGNLCSIEKTDYLNGIQLWLDMVEYQFRLRCVIYCSSGYWPGSYGASDLAWLGTRPLWVAEYPSKPRASPPLPTGWTEWAIWQYTDSGHLDGIGHNADLNRYNGSATDLSSGTGRLFQRL
jgi:GH25 family lysozyme M1 (1,4-beta-N-acetylmuramidase)/subtilisin family serine protease